MTSSDETVALIKKPYGVRIYLERQDDVLDCQKRYVSVITTEACGFVSLHPTLNIFLQVYDYAESGIYITDMPADSNSSASILFWVEVDPSLPLYVYFLYFRWWSI